MTGIIAPEAHHMFPPDFYVYRLCDPRNGEAFYVGKGKRERAWQHQRLVERGELDSNPSKCRRISEIIQAGADVDVEIVDCGLPAIAALELEFKLVSADLTLTNIMPGGVGRNTPPAVIEQLRRQRLADLRERFLRRRRELYGVKREQERRGFLAVARSADQAAEIANWLTTTEQPRLRVKGRGPRRRQVAVAPDGTWDGMPLPKRV